MKYQNTEKILVDEKIQACRLAYLATCVIAMLWSKQDWWSDTIKVVKHGTRSDIGYTSLIVDGGSKLISGLIARKIGASSDHQIISWRLSKCR